jgi:hypothetical protein
MCENSKRDVITVRRREARKIVSSPFFQRASEASTFHMKSPEEENKIWDHINEERERERNRIPPTSARSSLTYRKEREDACVAEGREEAVGVAITSTRRRFRIIPACGVGRGGGGGGGRGEGSNGSYPLKEFMRGGCLEEEEDDVADEEEAA